MTTSTPVDGAEESGMATVSETPLNAVDRCDRCGAQALVRTRHDFGELLWCKHHFEEHEPKLAPFTALDERQRLN